MICLAHLLELLRDDGGALLARDHELEALEIGEGRALRLGGVLLRPAGFLPGSHDALGLPGLVERLLSRVLRDLHLEVGERDALERNHLARDARKRRRAVDERLSGVSLSL